VAITVITTPGAADANSYCSRDDADTYHSARLHNSTWTSASDDTKDVALVMATWLLDNDFVWAGLISSTTQALRWPRSGITDQDNIYIDDDTIPDFLRDATAELAMWLIASDRLAEADTAGFSQIKIGSLFAIIDKNDRNERIPDIVRSMVSYYGEVKSTSPRFLERA